MKRLLTLVSSLIFSVLLLGGLLLSLQSPVAAAPAGPETLLSDDFEDGNADGWTVQAGDWAVIPEYSTYRVIYEGTGAGSRRSYYDTVTSTTWTDYAIQAKVMVESPIADDRWGMLMARWQDGNNYYFLQFQGDGRLRLRKYVGGSSTTLGTVDPGLLRDTWYTLTLEVTGDVTPTLRAYVDDTAVLTVTDQSGSPFTNGPCALGSYQGSAQFDDVVVIEDGTGNILLTEDFDDGVADDWTVQAGDWEIFSNYVYRVDYSGSAPGSRRSYAGDPTWTDYAIRAKVKIESPIADGRWGMLMARWQDENNYYFLQFQGDGRLRLRKYAGGSSTTIGTVDPGLLRDTWYTLTLEVTGDVTPTLRAYVDDTAVLTVTDESGSPFTSGPCALGSYEGSAQFDDVVVTDLSVFYLTVNKSGSGSGTVTSVPEGIDCGVTCTAGFTAGTVVSLTATPEPGDTFVGWLGACSGTGDCLVMMDAAKEVEAVFSTASAPALVVHKDGAGTGTVTSEPPGIDCGEACAASFDAGSTVTLTAEADTGSTFAGWSGACSGAGDCVLTMDADTVVTATFVLGPFDLNVLTDGNGGGTVSSDPPGIDCGDTCTAQFDAATVVTLTAVADVDSIFTGWSGGGCSDAGDCVVTVLADTDVIATFQSLTQTLTVAKTGNGDGLVTSDPAGIDCGETCAADYAYGTVITLTAVADGSSVFAGWSGAGCSGTDACVVTLDDSKTVEASFMAGSQTLTVVKTGNGSGVVTSDPAGIDCGATCAADFLHGIPVTLTATPAEDSLFIGWAGGGCSGNGDCVVTMDASITVNAAFKFNATLPFTDDFESGLNKWTVELGDWSEGSDDWHYRVVFTGTSPTSRRAYIDDSTVPGSSGWTDYAVQARFNIEGSTADNGFPWIIARWQNSNNYYYLGIEGDGDVRIRKYAGGSSVTLSDVAALGLAKDTWHTGKLEVSGSLTPTFSAYINGTLVLTATDESGSPFLTGPVGLGSSRATVMFDDVLVTDIEGTTTMFSEDFEDGADAWIEQSGVWELVAENIFYHTTYTEGASPTFSQSYAGAPSWTDYSFQARVRVLDGTYGMLIARRQDADNYYLMALRMDNGKVELKRMQPGGSIGLGSVNAGLTANTWYTATFEAEGNELRCYIDGTLVMTAIDNNLAWGEIGFGTLRASADFDDVLVTSLVPTYTLTVATSGSGSGVVTSDPADLIDCGDTCSAILEQGTVVTLTAVPDVGDTFAGWMGACVGTGDCVLTMDEAKDVVAVFSSESSPMLLVYKAGTGTGRVTSEPPGIDCGDTCAAYFTTESAVIPVTLVATPDLYSEFMGWEGAGCSGTGSCVVSLDQAKSVTATFTHVVYTLTVNKVGNGTGTVTSEPPGIDCGDTCSVDMGGVVTLTAVADTRSWFKGWDGEGCTGLGVCVLTMNASRSVTATFVSHLVYLPLVLKGYPPIPVIVDPLYVAPDGNDDNAGTFEAPFATLDKAVSVMVAGQTVYMRGGVYSHTQTISLTARGDFVNMYKIWAYPGEQPVLDFSEQAPGPLSRGLLITGDYWHIKGLEIQYAQDNAIKIEGSYNIIENCSLHHNQDTGLQIGLGSSSVNPNGSLASYNQIINCDSYRNFDEATNGSNADGFACKLHAGRGNSFTGCRAWENADDGWDLYDTDHPVIIENSWTWHNGDASLFGNPPNWGGNGNGFKVGGNYDNAPHILRNCIAFDNAYSSGKGFDQNHNMSGITIYNSLAWGNLINFSFWETPNDGSHHVLRNNVSLNPVQAHTNIVEDSIQDHNSWTLPVTATADDFLSLAEALAKAPRQADGSLPDNDFARLVAGSDLIDVGIDVGLPYCGAAPDLGAFESCP